MRLLKILFLGIVMVIVSGHNYSTYPVGYSKDAFWFCKFVGHTNDDIKILALSRVFESSPDTEYDDVERRFERATHNKLRGDFIADFPARCMDFESRRLAKKHHKRNKETAINSGYKIVPVEFP